MRPRHIESLYSADFAKEVLRGPGVPAVSRERFGALEELEMRLVYDQVQIAGLPADGAVAVFDRDGGRGQDFEAHGAAVAAAAVRYIRGCSIQAMAAEPATKVTSSAPRPY